MSVNRLRLLLIKAIASLLGFPQFPAFSLCLGRLPANFNEFDRPAGAAAAIFPDGREFAGRNAPTGTLSEPRADRRVRPASLLASLVL
jgi:hypothetical protein